jgi:hypothetical protein
LKCSCYYLHWIWSSKWSIKKDNTDWIAIINGDPSQRVLDMHTWLETWKENTSYGFGTNEMMTSYDYDKSLTVRLLDRYNNTQWMYHLSQPTMGVLFIILFYSTLHVSAYEQAIFRCLLTNHKNPKGQLLSNFSVDPPSHDIT